MLKKQCITVAVLTFAFPAVLWMGCEFGVNPLLFDGSPLRSTFTASTPGNLYADSAAVSLRNALSGVNKQVDSITVYNITLLIDNLKNGTQSSATLTGLGGIDGDTLVMLTNVPLSTFAVERSIFDPALRSLPSGGACSAYAAGVSYLNGLLKYPDALPTSVKLKVGGISSQNGLYCDVTLTLYTQVFVKSNQ